MVCPVDVHLPKCGVEESRHPVSADLHLHGVRILHEAVCYAQGSSGIPDGHGDRGVGLADDVEVVLVGIDVLLLACEGEGQV